MDKLDALVMITLLFYCEKLQGLSYSLKRAGLLMKFVYPILDFSGNQFFNWELACVYNILKDVIERSPEIWFDSAQDLFVKRVYFGRCLYALSLESRKC